MKVIAAVVEAIKKWRIQDSALWGGFALLGLAVLCSQFILRGEQAPSDRSTSPQKMENSELEGVDTIIPRGFVLVPIDLVNADSLQSMINGKAVVDLYLPGKSHGKSGHRIGKHLKLIQAPLNPEKYAVLVKEDESTELMNYEGPFLAVMQNPEARNEELHSRAKHLPSISIDYQNRY